MNILIDTSPLRDGNAGRGVGRYTSELLAALRAVPSAHHFFETLDAPTSVDLVHFPFFDLFFSTLPVVKRTKTVVTIHDVIPLVFRNQYPPGLRGQLRFFRQKIALGSVSHIVTDSACSKRDIIDHLHVSPEKISVVSLAAPSDIVRPPQNTLDTVRRKYELPKYFSLYVGDINYNKNLPFLISVWKRFPKQTLVLVGRSVRNTEIPEGRAIAEAIRTHGVEKRIRLIDSLESSSDLSAIYSLAQMYIQPSLYEGFGLPVLEAMQCKTPVVCARSGSLPEVAGDAAVYFHPVDADDCAAAIEKVLKFSERQRSSLIKKGIAQAHQFSWGRVATEMIEVYEKAVK